MADAENLLARGYDRAGNWDLAQVRGRTSAEWMRFPIDGFPKLPVLRSGRCSGRSRNTIGKTIADQVYLHEGIARRQADDAANRIRHPGGDPAAAVAKLKEIDGANGRRTPASFIPRRCLAQ